MSTYLSPPEALPVDFMPDERGNYPESVQADPEEVSGALVWTMAGFLVLLGFAFGVLVGMGLS